MHTTIINFDVSDSTSWSILFFPRFVSGKESIYSFLVLFLVYEPVDIYIV